MKRKPYSGPRRFNERGQLRPWLSSLSKDELVDWLWNTAVRDRILGESLRSHHVLRELSEVQRRAL